MGKGDPKTQAKRRKPMPALAAAPRPKARGRARMKQIAADPDAERAVLQARARQAGIKPKDLTDMRHPAYATPQGQAICAIYGDKGKAIADTFWQAASAYERYIRVTTGLSPHAKTAKIEMMPETFETRADDRPDLRTDEEKDHAARMMWARWKRVISGLSLGHAADLFSAIQGWSNLMDAGQITAQGRRFAQAAGALAEAVEQHE